MNTERFFGAYFGEPWPSGICDDGVRVTTPIGEPCSFCGEPMEEDDQGSFIGSYVRDREDGSYILADDMEGARAMLVPQHKECGLRSVLGGIGHIEDHERWCKGVGDPDGGRSRRQSSIEVWFWVQVNGMPVEPAEDQEDWAAWEAEVAEVEPGS
jgi:hypothetical protein